MKWYSPWFVLALAGLVGASLLVWRVGALGGVATFATFVLAGIGGTWGAVKLLTPASPFLERALLSVILAPIVFGIGGWISSISGSYELRFLPAIVGLVTTILVMTRKPLQNLETPKLKFSNSVAVGWFLGFIVLIPPLLVTLSSQRIALGQNVSLYNDIPWQISMTSESLARPAEFFPFLSDVTLAYPWMFHGFLGTLGSTTGLAAYDLVTQVWPIVFAILAPLAISFFAWRVSHNRWVASLSAFLIAFFVGPTVPFSETVRFPYPYSISPTYEFGIITLLALLTLLTYALPKSRLSQIVSVILIFFTVFVASGSKGSSGLIIVVMFATYFLWGWVNKKPRILVALQTVAAASGAMCAYTMTISGSSSDLNFNSLTFISNSLSLWNPVIFITVALMWLVGASWLVYFLGSDRLTNAWPSISAVAAGIVFTATFGHPGLSQNYFFWSVVPILAVLLIWAVALLVERIGPAALIPFVAAWAANQVVTTQITYFWDEPDQQARFKWVLIVVISLACSAAVLFVKWKQETGRIAFVLLVLAATAVATAGAQPFGSQRQVYSGAKSQDGVAISADQLQAFELIKSATSPSDLLATNRHCIAPTLVNSSCDGRYTSLTAFTERRALIEGHYKTSDTQLMERLARNDEFITSPTASGYSFMKSSGVSYIYVDKNVNKSVDLSNYAVLEFNSPNAQIWKLN